MLTLDFAVDESAFAVDAPYNPATANPAAIEETYFLAEFRFSAEGRELLGTPEMGKATSPLPLIGFASDLHRAILATRLGEARRCYLAGGGKLELTRSGATICISSSLTGNSVAVDAGHLAAASETLMEKVRQAVVAHVPEMQLHPAWGNWFAI